MRRRLFEDLVVSKTGEAKTRGYAVPASVAIHAALLSAVVIVPMLASSELPAVPPPDIVVRLPGGGPSAPPPPPKGDPATTRVKKTAPRPQPQTKNSVSAPTYEPSAAPRPEEAGTDLGACDGCRADGTDGGVPDGGGNTLGAVDGSDAQPAQVVRAGGDIRPPKKVKDVQPIYPEIARRAGVEGMVIIECTIAPSGRVVNALVLRGNPLLDAAALEAVEHWVYAPTLLNGVPVSVVMTVTVQFTLHR